ncbi:MAG: hypothetical protein JWP95_1331 [Actinotalea sp.]|nr:hypothetical protein [Actinotalea sp.]
MHADRSRTRPARDTLGASVRTARPFLVPTAVAAVLLLGACGSPAGSDASAEPTTDLPTTEEPAEPEEPADASSGAACLEGSWTASAEAAEAAALAIPGISDLGAEIDVTGTSHVTFEGGTMTTTYDAQASEIRMQVEGQDLLTTTTLDGTIVGTYSATDTEISLSDVDQTALTATTTTSVNGEAVEVPPVDMSAATPADGTVAGYTCDETTLVLSNQVEGGPAVEQSFARD